MNYQVKNSKIYWVSFFSYYVIQSLSIGFTSNSKLKIGIAMIIYFLSLLTVTIFHRSNGTEKSWGFLKRLGFLVGFFFISGIQAGFLEVVFALLAAPDPRKAAYLFSFLICIAFVLRFSKWVMIPKLEAQ